VAREATDVTAADGRRRRLATAGPLGNAPLVTKLLAAFILVLVLATLLTLLLETRLARGELRGHAQVLSAEQGMVLDRLIREEQVRTSQSIEALAQITRIDATDLRAELPRLLRTARLSNALEIGDAVSVTSGEVISGITSRNHVAPPGPLDGDAAIAAVGAQRVVPLDDGGYGLVYTSPLEVLGAERTLLAVGYALDDRRADILRAATGADDVEVVVDGRVVASTSSSTRGVSGTVPAADWLAHETVQETREGRLVRYVPLTAEGVWSHAAAVGLVTVDPLAALDDRLARTRVLTSLLLLALGAGLAFLVARWVTRPLSRLTATASSIAAGNLDASFEARRGDEIGTLAAALEEMRRVLRAQLLVIRRQAGALQTAARRIVRVQDAERHRLAQDLHDGIQQRLVVLRMQVGLARTQLREDPQRVGEVTDRLADSIDELLDELRATGQALFPSILRDRGLGGALFSLAARSQTPVDVRLDPDPLPRMAPDVEANAYFLASEALANAFKHAQASQVEVEVRCTDEVLELEVRDDGVGFDPSQVAQRGGMIHLRDRVNALAGTLEVVSQPGRGTSVTARLPRSALGALEEEEDGRDPSVQLDLLREPELPEDGVGVLLHGPIGDRQLPRDRRVASPGRHEGEDLELPGREPGEP
jgi:signal transduction histidine kinase